MAHHRRAQFGWLAVAALSAIAGVAQRPAPPGITASPAIPASAAAELQSMASHAAVIFAGQVVDISRNAAAGFVDIRFRIDQSLRGAPQSGAYVLREWAGLWTAQPDRYYVGERKLMLLSARGPAGMSSPIGGTDGAIPILATGPAASPNLLDNSSPAAFTADLRWIQARAERTASSSSSSVQAHVTTTAVGHPVQPLPDPDSGVVDWPGPIAPLPSTGATLTAQPATLAAVLALLSGSASSASRGASDARY